MWLNWRWNNVIGLHYWCMILPKTIQSSLIMTCWRQCYYDGWFFLLFLISWVFGRPFVKRFAICRCLSILQSVIYPSSVCNVGVLCSNGWMDQDATWYGGRPRPRPHCAVVCGFCWLCSKSAGALPLNQAERRESSDHLFARSRILATGSPCLWLSWNIQFGPTYTSTLLCSGGSIGGAKGAIAPPRRPPAQKNCNTGNVSSAHKTRNFCYICLSKTSPQFCLSSHAIVPPHAASMPLCFKWQSFVCRYRKRQNVC